MPFLGGGGRAASRCSAVEELRRHRQGRPVLHRPDPRSLRPAGQRRLIIEDGIFDGDFVFIRKQLQANRGDTAVAMIDDEATAKRYYPEGDTIRFQPANAAMQPIMVKEA